MQWTEYQERAAKFFSSLGLDAKVEAEVDGVRGRHVVDVLVTGAFDGIPFTWVVECKAWTSNIPKEKVMALYAIVQDVGADRGFLLSEVGFQSGALRAARSSNITLTSVEDLAEVTERFTTDRLLARANWETRKAKMRLMELKRRAEAYEYNPGRLELTGELMVCDLLLEDASEGKFPILYPTKGLQFDTVESVVSYAMNTAQRANSWDLEPEFRRFLDED